LVDVKGYRVYCSLVKISKWGERGPDGKSFIKAREKRETKRGTTFRTSFDDGFIWTISIVAKKVGWPPGSDPSKPANTLSSGESYL